MHESIPDKPIDTEKRAYLQLVTERVESIGNLAVCYDEEEGEERERGRAASPEFKQREADILEIVKAYKDDPLVVARREALRPHRMNGSSYKPDTGSKLEDEIARWTVLDKETERGIFWVLEKGLYYYRTLDKSKKLPGEEQMPLIDLTVAYQVIFLSNLRLVRKIAKRFPEVSSTGRKIDKENEGLKGLVKAITRFDVGKNLKFSTYAYNWITQSIQRALESQARPIRLPSHIHGTLREIQHAQRDLLDPIKGEPTVDEIAEYMSVKKEVVEVALQAHNTRVDSLNYQMDRDTGASAEVGDIVVNLANDTTGWGGSPEEIYIANTDSARDILELIERANLSMFEQMLISLSFGVYLASLSGTLIGNIEYDYIFQIVQNSNDTPYQVIGRMTGISGTSLSNSKNMAMRKLTNCTNSEQSN